LKDEKNASAFFEAVRVEDPNRERNALVFLEVRQVIRPGG